MKSEVDEVKRLDREIQEKQRDEAFIEEEVLDVTLCQLGICNDAICFDLLPKPRIYFYVCLIDGATKIFPTSYAASGNQTQVSSVPPLLRDLNPGSVTD